MAAQPPSVRNCYDYNDQGVCLECNDGFGLVKENTSTFCRPCPKDCVTCYGNPPKCSRCRVGYGKTTQGGCQPCQSEHCSDCSSDFSLCQSCEPGYGLTSHNNKTCSECKPGCAACYENSNSCDECMDGYALTPQRSCLRCPLNCKHCNVTGKGKPTCVECDGNRYLHSPGNICIIYDSACVKYDKLGTCLSCQDGHFLDSQTKECTSCGDGCLLCNAQEKCTKCIHGYKMEASNCFPKIANCDELNPKNETLCDGCSYGYFLSNNKCQKCPDHCLRCQDEKGCTECSYPYVKAKSGECVRLPENCAYKAVTDEGQCRRCDDGYGLTPSFQCVSCSQKHCSNCSKGYRQCFGCSDGFGLSSDGKCLPCQVKNCTSCSRNADRCESCQNGFVQSPDNSTCLACIDTNCLSCPKTPTICEYCNHLFGVNPSGGCSPCPNNCDSCHENATICTYCHENYGLVAGEGSECRPCVMANCSSCNSNYTECNGCTDGYSLSNTRKSCQPSPENCDREVDDTGKCLGCRYGYGMTNDGSCAPCSSGCRSCAKNADSCEDCSYEHVFSPLKKQCVPCSIPHCSRCKTTTACEQCIPGFSPNANGSCSSCPRYCSSCRDGKCQSCYFGYSLTRNGVCVLYSSPEDSIPSKQCFYGYAMDKKTKKCVPCRDPHCYDCFGLPNVCRECRSGFFLSKNKCNPHPKGCSMVDSKTRKCLECSPGYELFSKTGICSSCPRKCEFCRHGLCLSCIDGFKIGLNNTCVPIKPSTNDCPDGCSSCETERCTSCLSGLGLDNTTNLCLPCSTKNCLDCDRDYRICSDCSAGSVLVNGTCHRCPANCNRCDETLQCQYCPRGYLLENGRCSKCPKNCVDCRRTASGELSCFVCQCQPSKCFFLHQTGVCLPCKACDNGTGNDCEESACEDYPIEAFYDCCRVPQP